MAVQLVECTQQMMLIAQPALVFANDGRTGRRQGPILNGLPHLLPRPM